MDLGLSRFTVFGDTGDATVLRAPRYVPEVPDEQEVSMTRLVSARLANEG